MITLDDAWQWYDSTREQLLLAQRLGRKYWDKPEFRELVGRDDKIREVTKGRVAEATERGIEPLDDLAVLVLFAVFESVVRAELLAQIRDEADQLRHSVLKQAASDAADGIENGSFYKNVLTVLKLQIDHDLMEHVNQVRQYRNWVAHGRRGESPVGVTPKMAYQRLTEFLTAILPAPLANVNGN